MVSCRNYKNINSWIVCGTHGDPFACKDLYEILEYICKNSQGKIQINTNGGLRNPTYFKKIGELFNRYSLPNVERYVTFSIDGLEDTNHVYRRNVTWKKVWGNLMAYVSTGALAQWDYLSFRHNVHQIKTARELAKSHNIKFTLKNPFGVDKQGMSALTKEYKLDYVIEHATDYRYKPWEPSHLNWVPNMPEPIKSNGCIDCHSFRKNNYNSIEEIYVNALGQVVPCCFVGNALQGQINSPDVMQIRKLQESIGNKNSLYEYSIEEIYNNNILKTFSDSWIDKSISMCWFQCGKAVSKTRRIDGLFVK